MKTKVGGVHATDSRLRPSHTLEAQLGGPQLAVRPMHTPNSAPLHHLDPFRTLNFTSDHITQQRHNWECRCSLSVKCTPPTLVSINSSPCSLSSKHCFMSVHRSIQKLEIYCIISRLNTILHSRGKPGRAVVLCLSKGHLQLWRLSTLLHPLCLLNFVP